MSDVQITTSKNMPGNAFSQILTNRLTIRSYSPKDLPNCLKLYSDSKLTKFFDCGKPLQNREIKSLLEKRGLNYLKAGIPIGLFSVLERTNQEFLGQIDLLPFSFRTMEIGCIFFSQFHMQGYAAEALQALLFRYIDFLNKSQPPNEYFPIERVIATAHPKNLPSHKLIKSLGMKPFSSENRFGNPRIWYEYYPKIQPSDKHGKTLASK